MENFSLDRSQIGLLLIDVQERLFPFVEQACEVSKKIQTVIKAFQILNLPIFVTEQYPQGLGSTLAGIKTFLKPNQIYFAKTSFSCLKDTLIKKALLETNINQWVLVGIEAHVCILQTAKDLLREGKQVVTLNDAIASRSIYDFSTAIAEMRDIGIRITSTETILFELMENSKVPEFKSISELIKSFSCQCS